MSLLAALVLLGIQAIAEFFPVSSSAHLAFAGRWLGVPPGLLSQYIDFLHIPTALVVLVYFRRDMVRLLTDRKKELAQIALATLPAAVAAFVPLGHAADGRAITVRSLIRDHISADRPSGFVAMGLGLEITGVILILAAFRDRGEHDAEAKDTNALGWGAVLVIGLLQAVALIPGISRLGMTLTGGLLAGLKRREALRFAFLLSLPASGGALLSLRKVGPAQFHAAVGTIPLVMAVPLCLGLGLGALACFARIVDRRRLQHVAMYCFAAGLAAVAIALPEWLQAVRGGR